MKSHGQNHPMAHARRVMAPFGEIDFFKTGELGSAAASFKTSEGKEHAAGKSEAEDWTCEMYQTDSAKVQALYAAHAAYKHALPGNKFPMTVMTLGEAEAPRSVWQIEEAMVKSIKEMAGDENSPNAATLMVVFSVYGVEKTL